MLRVPTAGIVFFAVACASPLQERPEHDVSAIRSEIDSLWVRYSAAALAGDANAFAGVYSDSAYVIESGLPTIRGNSAIRSAVTEVMRNVRFLEVSVRPELTEAAGDRVLQFGTYRDVLQANGQPTQVVNGRFAAVFVRDSMASMRLSRLVAVADSTAPLSAMTQ